jgi:hypothetical protein
MEHDFLTQNLHVFLQVEYEFCNQLNLPLTK